LGLPAPPRIWRGEDVVLDKVVSHHSLWLS
jgi:hypothetical protein